MLSLLGTRTSMPRKGTVAVIVCVCLIAILGVVALTLDGGAMRA